MTARAEQGELPIAVWESRANLVILILSANFPRSGPRPPAQGEWITTVVKGTDLVRTCTFEYGKASYRPNPYFDCQGVNNGDTPPWFYVNSGERIVVHCYVMMNDQWTNTPDQPFYRIEPGSNRNVGFYMVARHSQLDLPYSHGIPQC